MTRLLAAAKAAAEALQEDLVCRREGAPKTTMRVNFSVDPGARTNAVGCQGLHAAQLQPWMKVGWISQEILHHGLMIAAQAHRAISHQPDRQQIDDSL